MDSLTHFLFENVYNDVLCMNGSKVTMFNAIFKKTPVCTTLIKAIGIICNVYGTCGLCGLWVAKPHRPQSQAMVLTYANTGD